MNDPINWPTQKVGNQVFLSDLRSLIDEKAAAANGKDFINTSDATVEYKIVRILDLSNSVQGMYDEFLWIQLEPAVKELAERWVNFRSCGDNVQIEIYQDATAVVADSAVCDRSNFTFFLEGFTEGQPLAGLPFGNYITNGEWADEEGNATTFTKFFEVTEYLSEDDSFVTSAMYTTDQQNDFAMKLAILEIGKSGMPNGGAVRFLMGFVAGDTDFNQFQL